MGQCMKAACHLDTMIFYVRVVGYSQATEYKIETSHFLID